MLVFILIVLVFVGVFTLLLLDKPFFEDRPVDYDYHRRHHRRHHRDEPTKFTFVTRNGLQPGRHYTQVKIRTD